MDNIQIRKLIAEAKNFKSFNYEWHQSRYNKIIRYLLKNIKVLETEGSDNKRDNICLHRELFYSATISLCCIQKKGSDRNSILLLQKTFQKLNKISWGKTDYPDDKYLNLLSYFMMAYRAYDYKNFPFHTATLDEDMSDRRSGSYELINNNEKEALLILGKDNLLEYFRSQRDLHSDNIWCLHEIAELMYQLDIANTDEIFDLCKTYIFRLNSTNLTFDLIRDEAIKSKTVDFLGRSLKTHLYKVENFLHHHMYFLYSKGSIPDHSRCQTINRMTYFGLDELKPLCLEYLWIILRRDNMHLKQMFMPSIIDENKTRFETAMEIFAVKLRFARFATEFKNYSQMEIAIKKFIDHYFHDLKVKFKFYEYIQEKLEEKSSVSYHFSLDLEELELMKELINDPIYPDNFHHLDKLFEYMLTFFGYEFKLSITIDLEKWIAAEQNRLT